MIHHHKTQTQHMFNITNLKSIYSTNEQARFRVYVRQKDWNPTIYTRATSEAQTLTIDSGSYRFYRVIDELDVIPYGTGAFCTLRCHMMSPVITLMSIWDFLSPDMHTRSSSPITTDLLVPILSNQKRLNLEWNRLSHEY